MCEIRFTLNAKDGKLENMVKQINPGIRTEVVKEALRYFLAQVRDEKVESMYIDSADLSEFKSNIKANLFTMDDVVKILDSRPTQAPMVIPPTVQNAVQQVNIQNETVEKEEYNEDEYEEKIEFNCDEGEILVNEDMLNMDF